LVVFERGVWRDKKTPSTAKKGQEGRGVDQNATLGTAWKKNEGLESEPAGIVGKSQQGQTGTGTSSHSDKDRRAILSERKKKRRREKRKGDSFKKEGRAGLGELVCTSKKLFRPG